jgi:methylthioribose-1-phosphate isomerase
MSIRTIFWENNAVVMIDQKALPLEDRYVTCRHYGEVVAAIKDMTIRGAPAIGVAAAMGIALGAMQLHAAGRQEFQMGFDLICEDFSRARPTARNLFWAIERMKKCLDGALASNEGVDETAGAVGGGTGFPFEEIKKALIDEAVHICEEDIAVNRRIGLHGRIFIRDGNSILTHCNAGALATAGYGTALGVIRAAHEEGKALHVFADETRPVLQGARLTAWELEKEGIPATLITDSTAGFLMNRGRVDLVIVGADRIAANGDTANKIGTYSLAVLAKENRVPFYVAAPLSTIDIATADGGEIAIEERDFGEVVNFQGVRTAPEKIRVYNPAFDVTPHRYITAIITEAGIVTPPYDAGIRKLCESHEA